MTKMLGRLDVPLVAPVRTAAAEAASGFMPPDQEAGSGCSAGLGFPGEGKGFRDRDRRRS